jgi:glutaredoxin
MNQPKVLAITKRTADLCGTQALLYGAGFDLLTATSMLAARSVIKAIRVKGVIVCRHSWTDQERDSIVADLADNYPEVEVVVRCPGCDGCDEATHTPGILSNTLALTQLMMALGPATKAH